MLLRRRVRAVAPAIMLTGAVLLAVHDVPASAEPACPNAGSTSRYVVLFTPDSAEHAARQEVESGCGTLNGYYSAIGVGIAESTDPHFLDRMGSDRAYSAQRAMHTTGATANQTSIIQRDERPASEQWNMAEIRAPQAQEVTTGSKDVVVGVLDSGIDAGHPELAAAVDPSRSADCLTGLPESPAQPWRPGESTHGTHVAGIIAAANDGTGVTGVAPGTRLASVRVVDQAGYAHPEYAVCGFMWAAEHGIRVANASFLVESAQQGCGEREGSSVPREAVRRAVEYATSKGVLTVAAVGNERVDITSRYRQDQRHCDAVPADLDGVLGVSAVGKHSTKAGYSSYGLGTVDLAAPGGENRQDEADCVRSTVPGGYGAACGTSMAAPHVSGVAALAASRHPATPPRSLAKLLTTRPKPMSCPSDYDLNSDSAQDALCLGYASYNGFYGHGMVDARNAVAP